MNHVVIGGVTLHSGPTLYVFYNVTRNPLAYAKLVANLLIAKPL